MPRRPIPSHLQVIKGAYDKNPQRRNNAEPKAPKGLPPCPYNLDRLAKNEWKRICGELSLLGVLSQVDRGSLEIYCLSYSKWRKANKQLDKDGLTIVNSAGNLVRHPANAVCDASAAMCYKLLIEFGLTPAARTRVQVEPKKEVGIVARSRA